jgi:hypothetical protein
MPADIADVTVEGVDDAEDLSHLDETSETSDPAEKPEQKPEEWKAALAELATTLKPKTEPQTTPARQPTQDEIDEYWGVWKPTKANPKFIHEFFNLPEDADPKLVEAAQNRFAEVQKNLVRQAVVGAQRLYQQDLEKLRAELQPDREFISEAKAERIRASFNKDFPDLAVQDENGAYTYDKIISLCAKELADEEFKDQKTYFKALAERAAGYIKTVNPAFVLGAATKQKPGATPRLPRTSAGGTGGAGGGKPASASPRGDATEDFLSDD